VFLGLLEDGMEPREVSLELCHDLICEAKDIAQKAIIELDQHPLELEIELIDIGYLRPLSPVVQIYIDHGLCLIMFK
jgi:hypothetical protein